MLIPQYPEFCPIPSPADSRKAPDSLCPVQLHHQNHPHHLSKSRRLISPLISIDTAVTDSGTAPSMRDSRIIGTSEVSLDATAEDEARRINQEEPETSTSLKGRI